MKIKNITQIILIAVLLFTGCSKERLDIQPKGLLLEASFFNTDDDFYRALVSTYDVIGWLYPWGMSWFVNLNVASDDANCGGENANDQEEYQQADMYDLTVTNVGSEQLWKKYYTGIYRANLVLDNADKLNSPAVTQYVAEAKFLRAYFYFDLVRFFGDVPLITGPVGSSEYSLPRTPKKEVFDQIVKDLTEAIPNIPVVESEKGRVSKGAAMALLGKVYLFMSSPYYDLGNHYQDAADQFANVIATGRYSLEKNYKDIFELSHEFGPESIFELNYTDAIALDWGGDFSRMEANIDIQLCGIRQFAPVGTLFEAGWGFVKPTQEIVDAYKAENDTTRYNASIISGDDLTNMGYTFNDPWGYEGYFRMKYGAFSKDAPANPQAWANNFRVIRLADVYLMLAECIVNGATDKGGHNADYYVDMVRERANLPDKTGVTMNDIMTERRLELSFEGLRYWDVLRWNKGDEIFGTHKVNEGRTWIPERKGLWPIPDAEILRTGGSLKQNPGY